MEWRAGCEMQNAPRQLRRPSRQARPGPFSSAKVPGNQEDIERQEREQEHIDLRRTLHAEWRDRSEDQSPNGYEPEDLDDYWDDLDLDPERDEQE